MDCTAAEILFHAKNNSVTVEVTYMWLRAVCEWLKALAVDFSIAETGMITVVLDSSTTVACVCDAVRCAGIPVYVIGVA